MKKLFMVLCVVVLFFGVVGCNESSDNPATNSGVTSTTVVSSDVTSTGGAPLATPEPTALILVGTGLIGLAAYGRKRFNK